MQTEPQTQTVSWNAQFPPVEPTSWYQWPVHRLSPHPLEAKLSWPHGCLDVLEQAFQQRLTRSIGWDLQSVPDPEPYEWAARVFKRGVRTSQTSPQTRSGSYPLTIEPARTEPREYQAKGYRILADHTVAECWDLQAGPRTTLFDCQETTKTLDTVARVHAAIHDEPDDEVYWLIGGGVFCDLAAFAVGLLGRRFHLIPTTLLAMVDACVGGKTGVNYPPYGKNQLGLFCFPEEVRIWPGWLKTLDQRQIKAGLAECYKHAFLTTDTQLVERLNQISDISDLDELLADLIAVKAQVVARDPGEKGERAILNLGHTFGHALEAVSHQRGHSPLLHGEAVGLGLAFQACLSHDLGYLPQATKQQLIATLRQAGCLVNRQQLRVFLGAESLDEPALTQSLIRAVHQDKKNTSKQTSRWLLLADFGKVVRSGQDYTVEVSDAAIHASLSGFFAELD
jgi:3-dehydroquinate synthase